VFNQVKHKMSIGFEGMGPQEVKNISEPVTAFRIVPAPVSVAASAKAAPKSSTATKWRIPAIAIAAIVVVLAAAWQFYPRGSKKVAETASEARMAFPLPDKPSIAVLPFDNLGGNAKDAYVADGLTENITTALSQIPRIFVIARKSSFYYKGKQVTVRHVAEELGVRYVLEGSVQKSGERVRINAQLIDATTGHHLWAERYDRKFKDLFSLQDEITLKIAVALSVELTEGEEARARHRSTNDLEAWKYAVKALNIPGANKDGIIKARDDKLSEGHLALASLHLFGKQYDEAVAEAEKAVALGLNNSDNLGLAAQVMHYSGRFEEALRLIKNAMRLDPHYSEFIVRFLGGALRFTGQHDQAIAAFKEYLRRRKGKSTFLPDLLLASIYGELGRLEEARAHVKAALEDKPNASTAWMQKYLKVFRDPAHAERVIDGLRKAGLPETSRSTAP
jgi:TolB-like protein/Flp pilus assembly protein TadD